MLSSGVLTVGVNHDAAAAAQRQFRFAGQFVPRPDAGGEDNDVCLKFSTVLKGQLGDLAGVVGDKLGGVLEQ